MTNTQKNKIGFLYRCPECNWEIRSRSNWRGLECQSCKKGVAKKVQE